MSDYHKLDFSTFDKSMETIKEKYNDIFRVYNAGTGRGDETPAVRFALKEMRNGWKSVKGYQTINALSGEISEALNKGSRSIMKCYSSMKQTMKWFAKQQGHPLVVGDIGAKRCDPLTGEYGENDPIELSKKTNLRGKNALVKGLERIVNDLNEMIDITASDEKFGYTDDGGSNPRDAMHKALIRIRDGLQTATDNYVTSYNTAWSEDETAVAQKMAAGATDMSAINFDGN